MPSLVLFDLDGVLVDYDRAVRVRHLASTLGVAPDAVQAALFDSGLEDLFDAGAVDACTYLGRLRDAVGVGVSEKAWAAARGAAMHLQDATVALVAAAGRRADVAVLTNNGTLLRDVLPSLLPTLTALFGDRLLCSGDFGLRKPDPEVYLRAVSRLGHPPARTLFLDDTEPNVEGARRAGLHAARVERPSALASVLGRYGLVD